MTGNITDIQEKNTISTVTPTDFRTYSRNKHDEETEANQIFINQDIEIPSNITQTNIQKTKIVLELPKETSLKSNQSSTNRTPTNKYMNPSQIYCPNLVSKQPNKALYEPFSKRRNDNNLTSSTSSLLLCEDRSMSRSELKNENSTNNLQV